MENLTLNSNNDNKANINDSTNITCTNAPFSNANNNNNDLLPQNLASPTSPLTAAPTIESIQSPNTQNVSSSNNNNPIIFPANNDNIIPNPNNDIFQPTATSPTTINPKSKSSRKDSNNNTDRTKLITKQRSSTRANSTEKIMIIE